MGWTVPILVFASLTLFGLAVRGWVFAEADRRRAAVKRRLKDVGLDLAAAEPRLSLLKDQSLSSIPTLDRLLRNLPRLSDLKRLIAQSAAPLNVGAVIMIMGLLGLAAISLGLFHDRFVLGLVLAPAAAMLPVIWLKQRRKRRLAAFEQQFPEAVGMMARAIRAGHSMASAMGMVGEEMDDPVAGEFAKVVEDYSFGKSMDDALADLVERVGLQDVKFFVTAVMLQRETGGNLAEILDNMGRIIRERFKLIRQVRTLSAEGRLSGVILSLMTPGLMALMWFLSPDYIDTLISTPAGRVLLAAGAGCQLLGMITIKKLVTLKV